MGNDNTPRHDATRRPQSRFSAGPITLQTNLPASVVDDVQMSLFPELTTTRKQTASALEVQPGGDHYKGMAIQPVQFIHANGIPYLEGNVIKYVCRWKKKNGVADLEKAKHYIDLLIELESKK